MIKIMIPETRPNTRYYYLPSMFAGGFYGPFSKDGVLVPVATIPYRHPNDRLVQGSELFGDKTVTHAKFDGEIVFNAAIMNPAFKAGNYRFRYPSKSGYTSFWIEPATWLNIFTQGLIRTRSNSGGNYSATKYVNPTGMTAKVYSVIQYRGNLTEVSCRETYVAPHPTKKYYMQEFERVAATSIRIKWPNGTPLPDPQVAFERYNTAEPKPWRMWSESELTYPPDTVTYDAGPNMRELFEALDSIADKKAFATTLENVPYTDLVLDAVKSLDANQVNMIAFLRDLKDPKAMIPKLKNLTKLSSLASDYLAVKYGVLPTISDLQGIWEAFRKVIPYYDRNGFRALTAGSTSSQTVDGASEILTNRVKLAIDVNDPTMDSLTEKFHDIGVFPTLENIWDLVPYSFVVDWFVDVGSLLETMDAKMRLSRLPVRYITYSAKRSVMRPLPQDFLKGYSGTFGFTHYSRNVDVDVPLTFPTIFVENELSNHWLEASALIVQRKRK